MLPLLLAVEDAPEFAMAPKDLWGMFLMGLLMLVLWLAFRKLPGLHYGKGAEGEAKPGSEPKSK